MISRRLKVLTLLLLLKMFDMIVCRLSLPLEKLLSLRAEDTKELSFSLRKTTALPKKSFDTLSKYNVLLPAEKY